MHDDEVPEEKSYSAPALEKGLDVLENLADRAAPVSMRELADSLGRNRNELFRMIHVLIARGYVERDPQTDEISLTNKLFGLGLRTPQSRLLLTVALPELKKLAEEFHQTPHLLIIHKGRTVTLAHINANADFTFNLNTGYGRPAAEATSGKVIMAFQPEPKLEQFIRESDLQSTRRVDRKKLAADLDIIRTNGHVVDGSTDFVGVTDICCPILGPDGYAVASMIITSLERVESKSGYSEMLQALKGACGRISERL